MFIFLPIEDLSMAELLNETAKIIYKINTCNFFKEYRFYLRIFNYVECCVRMAK